jgi:uncharacterized membrane protein
VEGALKNLPEHVFILLAARPIMDMPFLVQLLSRVVHILSVIILVGGLFYIRSILFPAGQEACFAGRRKVWARWVGLATLLLLVTGIYNLLTIINETNAAGDKLDPTYHTLIGIKILLSLGVMFLMAVLAGKTALAERFRGNMRKWLNVAWICALGVVVIAAMLRTFH